MPPWLPPLRPLLDPDPDHLLRGSGRRARSSSPRRRADLYTAVHTRSSCPRFRAELSCGRSRAAPARTAGRISHGRSRARLLPTAPSRALPQPGLLPGPLDQMDSKGKPKSKREKNRGREEDDEGGRRGSDETDGAGRADGTRTGSLRPLKFDGEGTRILVEYHLPEPLRSLRPSSKQTKSRSAPTKLAPHIQPNTR